MNEPHQGVWTPQALVGHVLADRYKVVKMLGEGGMGSVYLGEHVTLRKRVAIKVLHYELCRDQTQVDRFLQEARAASLIGHENIVDIVDFGPVPGGSVFFAMEFLEGEDLSDVLRREGRIPWARARDLMVQIVRALAAAHDKGIIHRDLKPANCFLVRRSDGRDFVKLLDFGIAKVTDPESGDKGLTRTGAVFGTAKYMAPEQACGEPADQRTDIYAAAICLYEFLTGQVPYDGDNFMRVLSRHLTEPLTPPTTMAPDAGITAEVEALIVKALSKQREDRYQSMREFEEALLALGPDGHLSGRMYQGPPVVGHQHYAPNEGGSGGTMWLGPQGAASAGPRSQPPEGRGGTMLLDPNDAPPDLEFGTVKLSGPGQWGGPGTPVADRSGATFHVDPSAGPLGGGQGKSPITTHPPPPSYSPPRSVAPPSTHAPAGDYTMFATEKRSPVKFIAMLVGGATIAIGGGALAAWLFLGGNDEEEKKTEPEKVVKAGKDEPTKDDPPVKEDPPEDPKGDDGLEIVPEDPDPKDPVPEDPKDPVDPKDPEPEDPKAADPPPDPDPVPDSGKKGGGNKGGGNKQGSKKGGVEPKVKERLEAGDVTKGFSRAQKAAAACAGIPPGLRIKVQADIRSDGTVLAAKALNNGGLPATQCILRAVRANAKFAKTTRPLDSQTFTYKF